MKRLVVLASLKEEQRKIIGSAAAGYEVCYPQLVGTIQLSGGRRHVKKYIWSF